VIVAVCPVAFFTPEHVTMTEAFLRALEPEVDQIGVWHNGGSMAFEGMQMLVRTPVEVKVHDAQDWGFFRMWNDGARWARERGADVMLVLNNDIEWPPGALRALAEALQNASPDVAAASPDPASDFHPGELIDIEAFPAYRGLMGWCFAIRPSMWQFIDERYHVWWGDDELGRMLTAAGWRCVRAKGVPVQHPVNETTMRHREALWEMRAADEALYNSKWS
jgi:GT2 family glycosyltransferase